MQRKHDSDLVNKLNFEDVLLDSLPNPVYYKDTQGRFIQCNTCFSTLVNTPKKDIIGKLAYEFFPKNVADRHKAIDKNIMKTLDTYLDEISFLMPDDSIKYFTLNKTVYLNEDATVGGIVCVMNDITERIKQKEFLIQQSKFAEMGEMIASIAHQWNEPLVELSAQIQMMELFYSMNKMDKDKMNNFVNDSMVQIKYMSSTLSDFRNFLKPSTVKKYFGIKKAIKEIFEIVGKQIFYFNIKVDFDYGKDENEIYIYGFENELKQVLLNIINNAKNKIVQMEEDKLFKALITIKIYTTNEFNVIEVIDNAGAIQEDIMQKIFEPFFTTQTDGTGFGLYMAKVIVEDKMDGKIEVKNDKSNVCFSIKIPVRKG
ncbi:MAG: PAS domain S-box-containing protein [Arcobacteraceae bacterium]|jgi:PAS domain S-box-containing protein